MSDAITMWATNNVGVIIPGTSPITHTFTFTWNTLELDQSNVSVTLTGLNVPQLYNFSNGEVFQIQIFSFTAPNPPKVGGGNGALGALVQGSLAGISQNTPEPGSFALLIGLGVAGSAFVRRRKKA